MKQISIALNIVLISLFIFYACKEKKGATDPASATPCPPCAACNEYGFAGIKASVAKQMASNYYTALSKKNGASSKDARCIWFSLDAMKSFICAIEKANCSDKLKLGIRIYYGRYSDEVLQYYSLPGDYVDRHTVFMVPTYEGKGNSSEAVNIDFNPLKLTNNCQAVPLDISSPDSTIIFGPGATTYKLLSGNSASSIQNHGDLIPPKTNSGAAFLAPQ